MPLAYFKAAEKEPSIRTSGWATQASCPSPASPSSKGCAENQLWSTGSLHAVGSRAGYVPRVTGTWSLSATLPPALAPRMAVSGPGAGCHRGRGTSLPVSPEGVDRLHI